MKKYAVCIPIAGYIYKEVEAENDGEAIDMVFNDWNDEDIAELEAFDVLVEGNVCYSYHTRATVDLIEDE